MTIVDGCRWINFHLPPKPKQVSQKIEDLDEDKLWAALLTKCKGYNKQFQLNFKLSYSGKNASWQLLYLQKGP